MHSSCEVTVRRVPGAVVLEMRGEIDSSAATPLQAAYDDAVNALTGQLVQRVVLDFTAVDYINSTGIAVIVGILAQARAARRVVAASGLSSHYRQIFDITRLSDFIQMYADVDDAIATTAPTV
ncbi:MAG TPA: STAS domain-containing protein [Acidothermaceae bacterium]|jgi:anti-sigma B factor antagonist